MGALVDAVDGVRCRGCPRREQLESQIRDGQMSAQAAEWPRELDMVVGESFLQQDIIDNAIEADWQSPASETGQPAPSLRGRARAKRSGRARGVPCQAAPAAFAGFRRTSLKRTQSLIDLPRRFPQRRPPRKGASLPCS